MRRFHSEKNFQRYRPHVGAWRRFWDNRKRRKREKQFIKQNKRLRHPTPVAVIKKQKGEWKKLWFIVKICALVAILIAWIYLLAYLPYFKINGIICSGLNNITKSEIETFVRDNYFKRWFFPDANYFLVNANKIAKGINEKFALEGVSVKKMFPDTLEIDIQEKSPQLVYDNGKKYFLLDANGEAVKYLYDAAAGEFATREILQTQISASGTTSTEPLTVTEHTPNYYKVRMLYRQYPLLYDKRGKDVQEKEHDMLPAEVIIQIKDIQKTMGTEGVGDAKYFILDDINTGVIVVSDRPYKIYFSLEDDPAVQIFNLKNILLTAHPATYVDLRFGNRVYWK